jgi:hypothetical protein
VPRGTPTAFPSLARERSRPTTRRPLNLTAATAGGATHRPAVRRPDPSALLAGTPTQISRSNRVGPSGQLLTLGPYEAAVKATFRLARRVCPARNRWNYVHGIPGDEPSLGPSAPWCHRFAGTATVAMAHMFAARSRVRGSKQPAAYARKVPLNRHLLEHPSPDRLPRHASHVIAAGTACWSPPQVRISGRGGHLPGTSKVDADLVPSAERATAQAPSPTPSISSSVRGGCRP